jgi:hypothetical protein
VNNSNEIIIGKTQPELPISPKETVAGIFITSTPTPHSIPSYTLPPSPSSSTTPDPYIQAITSPDGLYIAKLYCVFKDSWVEAIEIWNSNEVQLFNIPFQGEIPQGDPRDSLRVAGWSSDSTRLFFYYSWAYDGWYTLFDGSRLQYIDIETGDISEVVPGIVAFDFSSDNSKLAYLSCCELTITDLNSNLQYSVKIPDDEYLQAGWVNISPSGEKVVYFLLVSEGEGTAVLFDTLLKKQIFIVDTHFIEDLTFKGWDENENPIIMFDGSINVYDPDIKAMISISTVTPYPK